MRNDCTMHRHRTPAPTPPEPRDRPTGSASTDNALTRRAEPAGGPANGPAVGYGQEDWLAATAFDWIEQPLAALADAFFDLITWHHQGTAHPDDTRTGSADPDRPATRHRRNP